MIFRLSRQTYRLVGRLDEGDELVDVLTRICKESGITAAEIRAVGAFGAMELVRFDGRAKDYKTVLSGTGDFDLISLDGNVSTLGSEIVLRLEGIVNAMGPAGPQVVAGQIRSATAVTGEFVIDVFEDLKMERRFDAGSGRWLIDEIEILAVSQPVAGPGPSAQPSAQLSAQLSAQPAAQPSPSERPSPPGRPPAPSPAQAAPSAPRPGAQMSWGEAIEKVDEPRKPLEKPASRAASTPAVSRILDDEPDEPQMNPGDILDHPKLGRCRVIKVEDDEYAHIRLPRGKIRKLALEICEIAFQGEEDGRKVFICRIRK